MSNPHAASDHGEGRSGEGNDFSLAKAAGFAVFSGIALSILKTLNPHKKSKDPCPSQPLSESTQLILFVQPPPVPSHEVITKKQTSAAQCVPQPLHKTVEIVKGDTLWGLSKEYGVSVDAIREANGLTGDTIYEGKMLIIP